MPMLKVKEVIVVEGKYDKNTLRQIVDAVVISTDGFQIFSDREKLSLIRRMAESRGIILLTDSDGAGFVIRNYLKGAVDAKLIKNAYIPDISGKEKRKDAPSAENLLGVEGMSPEVIISALKNAGATFLNGEENEENEKTITKYALYADGFLGGEESAKRRKSLLNALNLPSKMTSNGLLEVLNILFTLEEYREFIKVNRL